MEFLKNSKGFTLIEIISVILVIGIIGAVAVPMFDTSTIDVSVAGDTVQGDIQYVQELAMTRDQDVSITFTASATSYDLPTDPGGVYPAETRDLPNGVSIQTGGVVTFNSFGERTAASAGTIVLNAAGNLVTITIEQYTGRASVS